jgi:arsenite methyltransferase
MSQNKVHQEVKDYYGKELQKSEDLKTNACCTMQAPPNHIQLALSNIHEEVSAKYYGCGLTIPTELKGLKMLDLGSGSGRDCYLASQLVGEEGEVVGVDMTDEQLAVANEYIGWHADKFGYKKSNVSFLKGNIEALNELGLDKNSFDLIISNCVINLASDKRKVLKDAYDLLKEGGEMYFSDVYADRRISEELKNDRVLYGECLSGALYWNDFLSLAKEVGFSDPRSLETKPITIENIELEEKVGNIKFYSVTYRLWKLPKLEATFEDFGQAIKYKGSLPEQKNAFVLDDLHTFKTGEIEKVCGNTYLMLNETRYKKHFDFMGDFENHLGIFEGLAADAPFSIDEDSCAVAPNSSSCC